MDIVAALVTGNYLQGPYAAKANKHALLIDDVFAWDATLNENEKYQR